MPGFVGLNFSGNHTVFADPEIIQRADQEKERGSKASRWQLEMLIEHGYALATVHRDQVDPDNYQHDFSDGIHPLFYAEGQTRPAPTEWGSIGAWAWSLSRVLDYLETDSQVDASRMAVIGQIAPDLWMIEATGAPVGSEALLAATEKALQQLKP